MEVATMYQVHGMSKSTYKFELVASGLSRVELDRLIAEETDNYFYLRVTHIRTGR
jgi:hypothetical protein